MPGASSAASSGEHFDVIVVGAGLSGLSAAYYLQKEFPNAKSFLVLESRAQLGGTWSLFHYPGIRSDSDMYTLGFSFRPWPKAQKSIAGGTEILKYLDDTAREFDLLKHIRFQHRVVASDFDSQAARWNLSVETGGADPDEQLRNPELANKPIQKKRISCQFLLLCSGYYRYSHGYTPEFPGSANFKGLVVHPQLWPRDLDVRGKRVVVIGSGATAVTLVPALAEQGAKEVTMLQRSPTYMVSKPSIDPVAAFLSRFLPYVLVYHLVRWKNIMFSIFTFWLCRTYPEVVKGNVRKAIGKMLPSTFDLDRHMKPKYNPWDQRFCLVPDGDFFKVLHNQPTSRENAASAVSPATTTQIVTDTISTWTESGIRVSSGQELAADIIVTATGLHLEIGGGMKLSLDGKPVKIGDKMLYRGMLLSSVPNLFVVMGYTNASWTLKCELIAQRMVRILKHMDARGAKTCVANVAPDVQERNLLDFSSSYILRANDTLPKQGDKDPWILKQNYIKDVFSLKVESIDDGVLQFDGSERQKKQN